MSHNYESSEDLDELDYEKSSPTLRKNMDSLIHQCKQTLHAHDEIKLLKTKRSPPMIFLNKYKKVLGLTLPEEHEEYFMDVYKRYRIPILANKNDKWLRKNKVCISYADKKSIKIMLSTIYNAACKLHDIAEEKLDGFPDEIYEECEDLIRKDIIMLHLYRIFDEFAPEKDKTKLKEAIASYEEILGLKSGDEISVTPSPNPINNLLSGINPENPLGSIGSIANTVMQGMNQTAKDNNVPQEDVPDIGKMLSSLLGNDQVKGIVNNLMTSLSNQSGGSGTSEPPNFQQLLGNLMQTVSSPEFKDGITSAIKVPVSEETPKELDSEVKLEAPKELKPKNLISFDKKLVEEYEDSDSGSDDEEED